MVCKRVRGWTSGKSPPPPPPCKTLLSAPGRARTPPTLHRRKVMLGSIQDRVIQQIQYWHLSQLNVPPGRTEAPAPTAALVPWDPIMTSKDSYNVLSVPRELRHYLEPRVPQIAKVRFSYQGVLRRGSIEAYVKTKGGGLSTVFNNNN